MTGPAEVDELSLLRRVSDRFEHLGSALDAPHWDLTTPCTDWNVGKLVDHVLGGNWFTIGVLNGQSADQAMAAAKTSFNPPFDRRSAVVSSTEEQYQAFVRPGALAGCYSHVVGKLSGAEVLRFRLHEHAIHNWDLARALGVDATIPADIVAWALAGLATKDSLLAHHFGIVEPSPGAPRRQDQEGLLAAFGRTM